MDDALTAWMNSVAFDESELIRDDPTVVGSMLPPVTLSVNLSGTGRKLPSLVVPDFGGARVDRSGHTGTLTESATHYPLKHLKVTFDAQFKDELFEKGSLGQSGGWKCQTTRKECRAELLDSTG